MHAIVFATILLARTVKRTPVDPLSSGPEAPSATDLLRAKRMADEAGARLQIREPKRGGWVRGGIPWERSTPHAASAPDRSAAGGDKPALPTRKRVR